MTGGTTRLSTLPTKFPVIPSLCRGLSRANPRLPPRRRQGTTNLRIAGAVALHLLTSPCRRLGRRRVGRGYGVAKGGYQGPSRGSSNKTPAAGRPPLPPPPPEEAECWDLEDLRRENAVLIQSNLDIAEELDRLSEVNVSLREQIQEKEGAKVDTSEEEIQDLEFALAALQEEEAEAAAGGETWIGLG
eukprot:Hpha_TRINITY_DN795_c0_g1::TRINITY_DN795_c0_g1_i1::g.29014::m.29014